MLTTNEDSTGSLVLKELRERLGDYLPFVSTDFVVCDVCGEKVRTWDFPAHVESEHYEPPKRMWRTRGCNPTHKRREKTY